MSRRISLVLPVDAESPRTTPLAPGVASFRGGRFGVVDNGLWQSMDALVAAFADAVGGLGATGVESTPFDHLAADFADQQAALHPMAPRLAGAVAGLGN
jgi:hypothetical protein